VADGGMASVCDALVEGADGDRRVASAVSGAGTTSCTPIVAGVCGMSSVCDALVEGADGDRRVASAVSGAGTPSSGTPIVAGACVLSACVSIGMGSTLSRSKSDVL
jgi:tetrahydromethanopterin S-methyltransferase subunit C